LVPSAFMIQIRLLSLPFGRSVRNLENTMRLPFGDQLG